MRTLLCAFVLSASTGIAAAQFVVPDNAADDTAAALEAGNRAWVEAYVAGDIDTLVAMYAPDAIGVYPAAGQRFEGQEGAREFFNNAIGYTKSRNVNIKEYVFREYGDIVIQNLTWDYQAVLYDDRVIEATGRSSLVSRKSPDGWYIIDYHPAFNLPPQ